MAISQNVLVFIYIYNGLMFYLFEFLDTCSVELEGHTLVYVFFVDMTDENIIILDSMRILVNLARKKSLVSKILSLHFWLPQDLFNYHLFEFYIQIELLMNVLLEEGSATNS